ncbi:YgaP family membrane protein [Spirosoma pulveris]
MKKNMGYLDRTVRVSVAIVLIALYALGITSCVWGIVSVVLAVIFIISSLLGTCPVYLPFGFSTNPSKKRA